MIGLFAKKYHIAIFDEDETFVEKINCALKSWYNTRVVVESYTNSHTLFESLNINKARNNPFDLAILSPSEVAEKMILKQTDPSLKVLMYSDESKLHEETDKMLL